MCAHSCSTLRHLSARRDADGTEDRDSRLRFPRAPPERNTIALMDRGKWDGLIQRFLHHRDYAAGTRDAYELALRQLLDWCETHDISPEQITPEQISSAP